MKNHVKFEHTRYRVYLVSWILNFPMFVNVNSDLVRTLPLKLVKCRSWDMFGINSFPCRVLLLRLILGRLFSSFDCQPLLTLDPWYFSSKPWYFLLLRYVLTFMEPLLSETLEVVDKFWPLSKMQRRAFTTMQLYHVTTPILFQKELISFIWTFHF